MSTLSWMSRVRAFFGAKPDAAPAVAAEAAWAGGGSAGLAMVGTAVADEAPPKETIGPRPAERRDPAPADPAPPHARPARSEPEAPATSCIDPLDPPWIKQLESLGAAGRELQGHRETSEALLRAVRQLPELTSNQTDHLVQTNRLLERQNTFLASILDTLSTLRASMQTMEESSRRHLTAIGGLETSHRQVLLGYQEIVLKTHRRLGRLAALATVLAALALGGVAWVLYLVLAAG